MADGKIRGAFNDEQFEAFCRELQELPAKQRTLEGIATLFEQRTGIRASVMAAKSFKDGPFSRYLERLNSGRETREALCAAAGAGVHPLDAIEEAAVIELQDHLTGAEGGDVDVQWIISQLVKLRMSISMREETRRKAEDLERKQRETTAKLEIAEQQMKLRDEQIARLQREKEDWEQKKEKAKAAIAQAAKKGGITADTRKLLEKALTEEAS
jgi:hypothetical protein